MTTMAHAVTQQHAPLPRLSALALMALNAAASLLLLVAAIACAAAGMWPLHGYVF